MNFIHKNNKLNLLIYWDFTSFVKSYAIIISFESFQKIIKIFNEFNFKNYKKIITWM